MLGVPLAVVSPPLAPVTGALALLVLLLGLPGVGTVTRRLAVALVVAGAVALLVAVARGARPGPPELFSVNQGVVGMIAAVSFTQVLARATPTAPPGRSGRGALWRTAGLVHGLGAVINLAAVDIVGGHLDQGRRRLRLVDGLLLSRSFSTAAFWSPFWASSATALAYAPRASPWVLVVCGLALAVVTLGLSLAQLTRAFPREAASYEGYSVSPALLVLPGLLVLAVLLGHRLAPDVAVSTVVLVSALVVTAVLGALRMPRRLPRAVAGHVRRGLPRLRNEAVLFVAAGVLSVGLSALFRELGLSAPVGEFTVLVAWVCVLLMALASLVGVHPIISIAALATLLGPIDPEPTLFALAATIAWGASAAVGPVSGLNVYLAGRFGLDGFAVARHNAAHLLLVAGLALPTLMLGEALVSR